MVEVRLDAGKSPRFAAAVRPTAGFDALPDTQHGIYRCQNVRRIDPTSQSIGIRWMSA